MTLELEGDGGSVTVSSAALAQIVVRATEAVDGARVRRQRRGLEIEADPHAARVELELAVRYGRVLPDAAREVQERVADALRTMCGVTSVVVDVSVEELEQ
jgi:uncharacterized alkaline shock family protein YloU